MHKRVLWILVLVVLVVGFAAPSVFKSAQAQDDGGMTLTAVGTYATGVFDEGAAEIVAYGPAKQNLYVVNGNDDVIDVINITDPTAPELVNQLDVSEYGSPNSVAFFGGLTAVAVDNDQDLGYVVFYDSDGNLVQAVEAGYLPDMLIFTPDGSKVLVANEGEPSDDYTVDPEGSVSIIDVATFEVTNVGFTDFNTDGPRAAELNADVRIYGPNATVAQDLEPEYIAVSADGSVAWVTLQENNAWAVIDVVNASVVEILPLGYKDFNQPGNGIDASNEDDAINIANWPAFGMYQPDAIVSYTAADGSTYLVLANEGDGRDYDGYSEEGEVSEEDLDETAFPNAEELQAEENLGKLEITTELGDTDGDGDYDALYAFGTRSISIRAGEGSIVWDSGDQIEQITAAAYPDDFNSTNDENDNPEDRSDNAGPEPEGLAIGVIDGRTFAFVGLERIGGVVVFDVTDPMAPVFMTYVNTRDFAGDPEAGTAGDLGPEGLVFISAENHPDGVPLLVVANEISGSTTVFEITLE